MLTQHQHVHVNATNGQVNGTKIFNLPSGKVKDYLLVHYVHGKIVVWIDYSYMLEVIVKLNYSLRSWEND